MIFVTVGTQKFPFDRLVSAADELASITDEAIFIQNGCSDYLPVYAQYHDYVDKERMTDLIAKCSLLITHCGVGTISLGLQMGKPMLLVPRRARFGEHIDDHQIEIAHAINESHGVLVCQDLSRLAHYVKRAKLQKYEPYLSCADQAVRIIKDYLESAL